MQAIAPLALEVRCSCKLLESELNRGSVFQDGNYMTQRDGFTGGFIAGSIVGGIVGGVIGAILASGRSQELAPSEPRKNVNSSEANSNKRQRRFKAANPEQSIELARRSLEDKIAQLNETIDEVRQTLGQVNGTQTEANAERISRSEDLTL